ncbi:MAG: pyridoxamine 5'-phosphate oxidase family protein [Candidatus Zambryskibacteria bacterium]|nr:pyridoxamine 5'-phosphate oxidase family protein [Candidatus Zambryskibacteria bacterium]
MDIKTKIMEVLSRGYLMSLATQDEGGVWVADVIYIYDEDLNIYWMSYPDVRHSQAIEKNGQAAGTITVTSYGEKPELGIQFSGKAEKLDTLSYDLVVKYCAKNGDPAPEEDKDVLEGHSWYVLRPNKIDLLDTENYGWDKKNYII